MAKKKAPAKKKPAAKPADGGETRNGEPFISATKKGGKRSGSKAAKAREYHASHPQATTQEIADAIGETYGTVYQALKKTGGKKKKKPGRKPGKVSAKHPAKHTNGHASVIETAAAFVASCGGLKSAQQVLEQLSIIGSA